MTARPGELPTWKLEDLYSSPTGPDLDADLKRQGVLHWRARWLDSLDDRRPPRGRSAPTGGIGTAGRSHSEREWCRVAVAGWKGTGRCADVLPRLALQTCPQLSQQRGGGDEVRGSTAAVDLHQDRR